MLDFRRNSRTPNYLGARQQRRLLVALAAAGLAVILVLQARHLESWLAPAAAVDGAPLAQRSTEEPPRAAVDARGPAAATDRRAFFPGVRPDYLEEVKDDTVFRLAEADAWFHLLALLAATDRRDVEQASLGRVGYVQLDQQAAEYRGRLVTLGGTVRGAKLVTAPPNDRAIKEYYQLWLQPERSSPELVVIYALELPEGFPLGTDLDAACTATGFFFKRWAYRSAEGISTAPLVLARTVDWQPAPMPVPAQTPAGEQFVWAVVIALVLAVLVVGFFVARERHASRLRRSAAEAENLQSVLLARQTEGRADVAGDES